MKRNEPVILGSARRSWNTSKENFLHAIYCMFCSSLPNGNLLSILSTISFGAIDISLILPRPWGEAQTYWYK